MLQNALDNVRATRNVTDWISPPPQFLSLLCQLPDLFVEKGQLLASPPAQMYTSSGLDHCCASRRIHVTIAVNSMFDYVVGVRLEGMVRACFIHT